MCQWWKYRSQKFGRFGYACQPFPRWNKCLSSPCLQEAFSHQPTALAAIQLDPIGNLWPRGKWTMLISHCALLCCSREKSSQAGAEPVTAWEKLPFLGYCQNSASFTASNIEVLQVWLCFVWVSEVKDANEPLLQGPKSSRMTADLSQRLPRPGRVELQRHSRRKQEGCLSYALPNYLLWSGFEEPQRWKGWKSSSRWQSWCACPLFRAPRYFLRQLTWSQVVGYWATLEPCMLL